MCGNTVYRKMSRKYYNVTHFTGIALKSTAASTFQRIRTRHSEHAEHSSRLTRLAGQIYVHMTNFHPISLGLRWDLTCNRADSFPM